MRSRLVTTVAPAPSGAEVAPSEIHTFTREAAKNSPPSDSISSTVKNPRHSPATPRGAVVGTAFAEGSTSTPALARHDFQGSIAADPRPTGQDGQPPRGPATDGAPNAARLVAALTPLLRGYGAAHLASWTIQAEADSHGRTWVVVRAPHPVSGEPGAVVNVFPPSLAPGEALQILRGDIAAWGRIARRKVVEDAYAAWEGGMAGVR
jgi:hypothetical protein